MRDDFDHLLETLDTALELLDRMQQCHAQGLRWSQER